MLKKLMIAAALLLPCTGMTAEWTQLDSRDDKGGYTVYVNLASIQKARGKARMWSLIDYQRKQENTGVYYLSKQVRRKYDCQNKHVKELAFKLFSWNMSRGELVRSYNQPQEWKMIAPDSVDELEWKTACNHPNN